MDIVIIWALVILLGVAVYVVLDGFDLGVGIYFPFVDSDAHRDTMMLSIGPIWGVNETWMVLGGAALFGAFPIAYSVILSALYIPITLMLLALIFRGVSFEYRARASKERQHYWDWAFFLGSVGSAFTQGIIAGAFISGFSMEGTEYVGGPFYWITPFNLLAGLGLTIFYALLGGTWLLMKSSGELHKRVRYLTRRVVLIFLFLSFIIFAWTLIKHYTIFPSWKIIGLLVIAFGMAIPVYLLIRALNDPNAHYAPFIITLLATLFGALGLVLGIWPYVIPFEWTIWEAAAPYSSLRFTLIGTVIFLPLIAFYTGYSYYIFRGKTDHDKELNKEAVDESI